jgi:predicted ribosome quality control (RQC) complex YloA/Tae2 family protein
MHVDALTLSAIAGELRATLMGARIDDVIQPTPHAVALQCYGGGRNTWLLASAHPQLARVHLVEGKPRKLAAEPPAFIMLLRKHLEGARIHAIQQPRWERLLEIGFARGPVAMGAPVVWLVVETMGRISNVILRDDAGVIFGALNLVSAEVNRYRAIAPHVPYRYPPAQTRLQHGQPAPRLEGEDVSASALREVAAELLAGSDDALSTAPAAAGTGQAARGSRGKRREAPTVAGLLSTQVLGFSRELGREVAVRALGAPDVPLALALPWGEIAREAQALAYLPESGRWQPTLVYAGADGAPIAYAVYEPRQYGQPPDVTLQPARGVNAMLDTFYRGAEWRVELEGAKAELKRLLQTQRDRCQRKDIALREELKALDEAHNLRVEADILLAFQTEVPPKASSVTLENPFAKMGEDGTAAQITLALDPRLSAVENANRRYARYHKLQRAASAIPAQIEANGLELARIEQLQTDLALAENPAEIALVRAEVVEAGYLRGKAAQGEKARSKGGGAKGGKAKPGKGNKPGQAVRRAPEGGTPFKRQSADGFTLLVGKNSRQNEEVTFHQASANDLWLHARGVPGAHVIVKNGGRPVPEATLRDAAALAAYYSQAREAGSVLVDYTEQRYVRHMKGGGPGMVIYERERTLHVAPSDIGA